WHDDAGEHAASERDGDDADHHAERHRVHLGDPDVAAPPDQARRHRRRRYARGYGAPDRRRADVPAGRLMRLLVRLAAVLAGLPAAAYTMQRHPIAAANPGAAPVDWSQSTKAYWPLDEASGTRANAAGGSTCGGTGTNCDLTTCTTGIAQDTTNKMQGAASIV